MSCYKYSLSFLFFISTMTFAGSNQECFEELIQLANKKHDNKELSESIILYEKAYSCSETKKQKISVLASLAVSEFTLGNTDSSIIYLKLLLAISPTNEWAINFIKKNNIKIINDSLLLLPKSADDNLIKSNDTLKFKLFPKNSLHLITKKIIGDNKVEIFASGEIDANAGKSLIEFIKDNHIENAVIVFDSPGGSLIGGVKLGKVIRELGFDTAIGSLNKKEAREYKGICASSCAYAFAGGIYRHYNGENEKIGIHQFYNQKNNIGDVGDIQEISSIIVDHLQTMGVDTQAFVIASSTRGDDMFWLTPKDAERLKLSNNGSDETTAEIKISGMNPYLKLEQTHDNVTARVIFSCVNQNIAISAGIVTTPELSTLKKDGLVRTYLEVDNSEKVLEENNQDGTSVVDSVLWLHRPLNNKTIMQIAESDNLGIWTENGGDMRWGAIINITLVKDKILYFVKNCTEN